MKLQFKHQKFQEEAAKAVCDVFRGQPHLAPSYILDPGASGGLNLAESDIGCGNQPLASRLTPAIILQNLRDVQLKYGLKPSERLEKSPSCALNLSVEMETGVGKTYTYIKTIYELNRAYGWSKFIVVVPTIAIREGVSKTFEITQEHFSGDYGKRIRFFIYNSAKLNEIRHFARDSAINVMIINNQAFNVRGKAANLIYMEQDSFGSRTPMDVIANTHPIMIIDEPQSVEGKVTRERLKEFKPMLTLRYSATHRPDSIYNMIYRLDAQEAYNRRLVKKIEVKGFHVSGATATTSYIYVEKLNITAKAPTVTLEFDYRRANGDIGRKRHIMKQGDDLFNWSSGLEEYQDGYIITEIDGRDNHISFVNGIKMYAGEVAGHVNEDYLRRLQIRETILSHLEREQENFARGIKTLSLFFIDKVANYRAYDKNGNPVIGKYAQMFEEEYEKARRQKLAELPPQLEYPQWLKTRDAKESHAGYFSIDKTKKFVDSDVKRGQNISDDVDAYTLIMKDRERLLDLNEPVRFIFSHSALREGWDNPNVFQICTLRQTDSDVRKRQEIGRGMRLCVNNRGERMDTDRIGPEADDINLLTVIASDSYEEYASGLQREIADELSTRPIVVDAGLFAGHTLLNPAGESLTITRPLARLIVENMAANGYLRGGKFTEKYWRERRNGNLRLPEEVAPFAEAMLAILNSVYDPDVTMPGDARMRNVSLNIDEEKRKSRAFQELWAQINAKSAYTVKFDERVLIEKSIAALNKYLDVQKIYITMRKARLHTIESQGSLLEGRAFEKPEESIHTVSLNVPTTVKYDILGRFVEETGLTRGAIAEILTGLDPKIFAQYRENPEDFITRGGRLINNEKAAIIMENITYYKIDDTYDSSIFTDSSLRGQLGKNSIKTSKHLYDHLIYDSEAEKKFAQELEKPDNDVQIYVKLPKQFYISTPMGKYTPDWAIAFKDGGAKYRFFVAEFKGRVDSPELRAVEKCNMECARRHLEAISAGNVKYVVVKDYNDLLKKALRG